MSKNEEYQIIGEYNGRKEVLDFAYNRKEADEKVKDSSYYYGKKWKIYRKKR